VTTDTAPDVAPRVKLTLDLSTEEADFLEGACINQGHAALLGVLVMARRAPPLAVAPPPPAPPKKAAKAKAAPRKPKSIDASAVNTALGSFASQQLAGVL